MPTPMTELSAQTILRTEKRKTQASAVLARPDSGRLMLIVAPLLTGMVSMALSIGTFEAPLPVKLMLATGLVLSILNAMDLWTTRRRLEAAITLLQLEQD